MNRRLPHLVALALAALALLPTAASAKEIVKAQICGADDCVTVGPAVAMELAEAGPPTDPPKQAAPFFTAELTVKIDDGRTDSWKTTFVPRDGLVRGSDGTWMDAPVQTENAFKRAARDLGAAFPPPPRPPLPRGRPGPPPKADRGPGERGRPPAGRSGAGRRRLVDVADRRPGSGRRARHRGPPGARPAPPAAGGPSGRRWGAGGQLWARRPQHPRPLPGDDREAPARGRIEDRLVLAALV